MYGTDHKMLLSHSEQPVEASTAVGLSCTNPTSKKFGLLSPKGLQQLIPFYDAVRWMKLSLRNISPHTIITRIVTTALVTR